MLFAQEFRDWFSAGVVRALVNLPILVVREVGMTDERVMSGHRLHTPKVVRDSESSKSSCALPDQLLVGSNLNDIRHVKYSRTQLLGSR